jgi:hypothetical protein
LNEFLFGSERNNLAVVRPILMDLQRGPVLLLRVPISGATAHVDHFIAWSRYPNDLGHISRAAAPLPRSPAVIFERHSQRGERDLAFCSMPSK